MSISLDQANGLLAFRIKETNLKCSLVGLGQFGEPYLLIRTTWVEDRKFELIEEELFRIELGKIRRITTMLLPGTGWARLYSVKGLRPFGRRLTSFLKSKLWGEIK
jgi:hypothetical protein